MNIYQNYYTASDVQLYMSSLDHTKVIKLDTAIGIGYSVDQSTKPVYTLGSRKPCFFSHGNTLGQGDLDLVFTDEEALKYAINYVTSTETNINYKSQRIDKNINNQRFIELASAAYSVPAQERHRLISIGAIQPLVNIKLYLNNETLVNGSDSKVITLTSVKFNNEQFGVNTFKDGVATTRYSFLFKDVYRG